VSIVRRTAQVLALTGTLLIGVLAVALIVSQTPWFKDWLRRYVLRQSEQYLNGQLSIGRLSGNLLFGVDLADVAIDVSGERVVSVKHLQVDYSVFDFISRGLVVDDIKISEPRLVLRRDETGKWNLASLVKEQAQEAEREGPARPVAIGSIGITSGDLTIHDGASGSQTAVGTAGRSEPPAGVRLPDRIRQLDAKLSFHYAPVRFTVVMDHLSFRTETPALDVNQIQGTVAVRDADLHVENLKVRTAESALNVDGVVERYASAPVIRLEATSERLSLPEIGRVVPAVARLRLHPSFSIKATGPLDALGLEIHAKSEAGDLDADLGVDAQQPGQAVRGTIAAGHLNLARLLNDPAQRSDITGRATLDVTVPPAGVDAARGTFRFEGPRVSAAGYEARNVSVRGRLAGRRVEFDGKAQAYGGAASARGFVVTPGRGGAPLRYSADGRASGVNLRALPRTLDVPRLATNLNAEYHVEGAGSRIAGEARLQPSAVEGATIENGTTATFSMAGPGRIEYSARGGVREVNVRRLGRALGIAALAGERYESEINARFDVRGSGTSPRVMRLDATGAVERSRLFGGEVPDLSFTANLADGALHATARGELAGFDPAVLAGRPDLKGRVGGRVDVEARVPDINAFAVETMDATARVELAPAEIAGLTIVGGRVDATLQDGLADVRQLSVSGPDLRVDARGRVALTEAGSSDFTYHLESHALEQIGKLVNQPLQGGAVVEGTVTGSRSQLQVSGTLDGHNLRHGDNGALDVNSTFTVALPELRPADARVEANTRATFVKAGGVELQEITAKTTYAGKQVGFDATVNDQGRQLQVRGDTILHPDHSEIHLPQFALRTQGIEWRLAGAEAAVQYGGNRVSFQNVRLQNGTQVIAVDGAVATGGEQASGDLTVRAENVDLVQLQRLLLRDRGVSGSFSANARLTGSLEAPRVDGRIAIANGGFRDFRFESFVSKVDYTSSGLTVDARLQQNAQHWLTVTGTAPMTLFKPEPAGPGRHAEPAEGDRVDLRIQSSRIDLGVIQGFTPQVTEVRGTLQADVRVQGSGHDPHVTGSVAVQGGAFSLPALGTSYTGLDTTIQLASDKVIVPGLQISDAGGNPLLVAGELAVHARSVGAFNVRLQSDNFELIDNELGDVGVDSNLRITGELRRPRIEGEVKLEDARVEVDEVLAMASQPGAADVALPPIEPGASAAADERGATEAAGRSLQRSEASPGSQPAAGQPAAPAEASAEPAGTLFENVTMDVRLRIPDNLVLRGSDLRPGGPGGLALGNVNLTVGGDVRARKQEGDTVRLVGVVRTVRGFYEFQGRRFDVERDGVVRFVGLEPPNPVLDIRATRVIDGVEARVRVTGTAKSPELELSSNPPLDEADILSLIVFNRSINDLNAGERISLAQRAGAVAGGFVAAPLAESIGRALDVDLFEIEATDQSGLLGPGITLGQQIGEHLFVKFRQQFGAQDTSEFIVEYQIADFMRLRTSGTPTEPSRANRVALRRVERAGADLIFFFSY